MLLFLLHVIRYSRSGLDLLMMAMVVFIAIIIHEIYEGWNKRKKKGDEQ